MTKKKVAILGGGVGAMTAAFHLTNVAGWNQHYDVTVYQLGWRLGGKGASGRNLGVADRIEEHGLHVWFGFYENAFQMIERVYDECREQGLLRRSPIQCLREAFQDEVVRTTLADQHHGWHRWFYHWERQDADGEAPALTDDEDEGDALWTFDFLGSLIESLDQQFRHVARASTSGGATVRPLKRVAAYSLSHFVRLLLWYSGRLFIRKRLRRAAADKTLLQRGLDAILAQAVLGRAGSVRRVLRRGLLAVISGAAALALRVVVRLRLFDEDDPDTRRIISNFDVGLAVIRGLIRDDVFHKGFDSINDEDFRAWLGRHGSRRADVSSVVRAGYDAIFALDHTVAAGAALSASIRLFATYRGRFAWRMAAGMGETVFAPLYLLLKARGVDFRFFHRVRRLGLSPDGTAVDTIDIDRQGVLRRGRFDPLVWIDEMPCWPSSLSTARADADGHVPLASQLTNGAALVAAEQRGESVESIHNPPNPDGLSSEQRRLVLRLGADFDVIVLGIPIGALPDICSELIDTNTAWRAAVGSGGTTATQAFQVWLTKTAHDLGWTDDDDTRQPPLMTGYVEPFDTYADFSHTLPRESWTPADGVAQVAYFANALPDDKAGAVKAHAVDFLERETTVFWPYASPNGHFDWSLLVDRSGATGRARFDAQFHIANREPSGRYVLSPAGSITQRLKPDNSGFTNLFLAGDWTYNVISNIGFVEGATVSGIQAASAVCTALECPALGPPHVLGAFGRRIPLGP